MSSVAAYIRVSTRKQKTDGQVEDIKRWLVANGYNLESVTWYEDKETGKTLKRPAFDRLQGDIFDGKVKSVICWKLDRLSRRLRDGVNLLADWCEKGLKIIVVTQRIELNGAVGRMIAAVMMGLAEIELEYRQERQSAGIAVARRKGVYRGRKQGTTKAKRRALQLRAKGLTAAEIAESLGISERTIWRYIRSQREGADHG